MSNPPPSNRLGDYTGLPLEILVVTFSVAPILILAYLYPALPERIPVFLDLRGEVQVWAAKSIVAVFRVPAMAIDLQLIGLLMKYGTVKSQKKLSSLPTANAAEYLQYQRRATLLAAGLWDWLRLLVAFKMAAESLYVIFMNVERLRFLWTPARAITWIAAIFSIVAALYYGYRLWILKREMKGVVGLDSVEQVDKTYLLGGLLYFNPDDPAPFVARYAFNFANKWVYALLACLAAYPLLVFAALL